MNDIELSQSLVRLNLSPAEAAQLLGVTPRTVRRWLDGEEITGPAEQAIRAWIRLHDRHLPWQPDAVSIVENNQEQLEKHRFHTVDLDKILSRVEARGGPKLPWNVDWDKGRATCGPMEVGFYKLANGGFSWSTYRRTDRTPDVQEDREAIEEAIHCIAAQLKKQNRNFGPVVLIIQDGPAIGRIASQQIEEFSTLKGAIDRACEILEQPNIYQPFVATKHPMEVLFDHRELERICNRRKRAPSALHAVAVYVNLYADTFVRLGPKLPTADAVSRRVDYIKEIASKIHALAKEAGYGLVSYQEFDALLGALHAAGFYPENDLISSVAQALR